MDYKTIIKRSKELGLSTNQIAHIVEMHPSTVGTIIEKNGWYSNKKPGCMPDSYFIEQLSNHKTILEIAQDLGCTRAAIYNLLKRRGITPDAYR